MKVDVKKLEKLKRKITVEISNEEFLGKKKEIYGKIGRNLRVPGFRPGNIPLPVLEKHHGKILKEEFLRKTLPGYYQQALEESQLVAVSTPRIYDVDIGAERLVFCADFEIGPEFEVKDADYKGIKIKSKTAGVEEIEVEKALTNMQDEIKKVAKQGLSDDDLAKWAGYSDIKKLKEALRCQIMMEKLKQRRQNIDAQVGRHLLKNIKFDVSKSQVQQRHKEMVEREVYNLQLQGVPEKDIDKYKKDIEDKLEPLAAEQIKLSYIINAIAEKENIETERNLGELVLGYILSHAVYE